VTATQSAATHQHTPIGLPGNKTSTTATSVALPRHAHTRKRIGSSRMSTRQPCIVIALLSCVLVVATPASAEGPGITVENYMKMDRHDQTLYMVGLIEGFNAEAITARMTVAHNQGRSDKEVEAEVLACRWDSYASIKAYVEAALYRIPRERWASTRVAIASLSPLAERFNAGCPWGK